VMNRAVHIVVCMTNALSEVNLQSSLQAGMCLIDPDRLWLLVTVGSCQIRVVSLCCAQISIPQVKSLYKSSAHIKQPCAGGSVRSSALTQCPVPVLADHPLFPGQGSMSHVCLPILPCCDLLSCACAATPAAHAMP